METSKLSSTLMFGIILGVSLSLSPINIAGARESLQCKAEIATALNKYNIKQSTIKKIYLNEVIAGRQQGGGGYLEALEGWIDFNNCKGSLVIKMSPNCDFEEIYSRHECKFPNIKQY